MLHIILMLLKIIGIVLLIILGILFLALFAVIFVPLRYSGDAKVSGSVDSILGHLKFSWFLHLVSGYVSYKDRKATWQVRVLWKKINTGTSKPKKTKQQFKSQRADKRTDKITEKETRTEKKMKIDVDDSSSEIHTKKARKKYTFQHFCDKIKLLIEKKESFKEFVSDEIHKASWNRVIQEIVRLIKYLRPKKLILNLHFGFDDPSLTGKVLGGLSILYPFYIKHMNITPDFEQKVLEGDVFIKGTIRGVHALIILWNLIFDKNIRATYKEIQNWKG